MPLHDHFSIGGLVRFRLVSLGPPDLTADHHRATVRIQVVQGLLRQQTACLIEGRLNRFFGLQQRPPQLDSDFYFDLVACNGDKGRWHGSIRFGKGTRSIVIILYVGKNQIEVTLSGSSRRDNKASWSGSN